MEHNYGLTNFFSDRSGQFDTTAKFIIIACLVLGVLMLIAVTVNSLAQTKFAGNPISKLVGELMGTI